MLYTRSKNRPKIKLFCSGKFDKLNFCSIYFLYIIKVRFLSEKAINWLIIWVEPVCCGIDASENDTHTRTWHLANSHLAVSTINIRRHYYDYIIIEILIIPDYNIRRVSVISMELRRMHEFRDELKVQTYNLRKKKKC